MELAKARALLNSRSFPGFSENSFRLFGKKSFWGKIADGRIAIAHRSP
jgi:hypothetical protein